MTLLNHPCLPACLPLHLHISLFLYRERFTSSSRLGLWGRSAGGLTLGATINMQPGVAAAAVLDVPFLDVLGDMSDPELPLTIKERGEWGDPLASKVGGWVGGG